MSEQFEARLQECLDALDEWGQEAELEAILARYPEDAAALRQVLRLTGALAALDMQPDAAAQERSRREFLAAGLALRQAGARRASSKPGFFLLRAWAFLAAALAVGAIPVAASGNALPGDALYPVKREVETVQLQMAPDDAARKALAQEINSRRIQEVDDLVKDGRTAQAEFEGHLEALTANAMTVSGRVIAIPAGAQISGWAVGERLEVTVQIEDGRLVLVSARPVPGVETPTPAPVETQTAQPATAGPSTPEPSHESGSGGGQTAEPTEGDKTSSPGDGGTQEPTSGSGDGGQVQPTETGGDGGSTATAEPTSGGDNSTGGGSDGSGSSDGGGSGGGSDGGGSGSGGHGGSD